MLLTDKQAEKYVEWFKKTYKNDAPIEEDWRMGIPVIYSEDPEKTEQEHKEMWLKEIRKLMWKNADKKYTHRGGNTETYAEAQFNSLWLYHGPYFKHINEKENATK